MNATTKSPTPKEEESEEEDYMSFSLPPEPPATKKAETSLQRTRRLRLESAARGHQKSKAEKAAEEESAREKALQTSLISSEEGKRNKGFAMMAKMGFKPGEALGKEGGGRVEPIAVERKEDRGGIGLEGEKKRRWREEVEEEVKRRKVEIVDEGDYRERVRREREEGRLEGLVGGAMRIVERFDEEREEEEEELTEKKDTMQRTKPLKSVNILYRSLIRNRCQKERERRMRNDLQQSLSRLPTYDDPSEDTDYKIALGSGGESRGDKKALILEEELEEEDEELEAFLALHVSERLERLVEYLRREYWYCFWCKFRYGEEGMEGCPGVKEEDHD